MHDDVALALLKFLSAVAVRVRAGSDAYVVGGAVRNHLLGVPLKDVDIVVDSVALGRDSDWFARQLIKAIPARTNLATNQYGVAILSVSGEWILEGNDLKGEVIEIANARKESYGGAGGKGYKPSEVVPSTIQEDIARREFTFNTLMWRLQDLASGPDKAEIIDITGCGLRDLERGEMRCPSNPDKTFSDDPTRILRSIKFFAKYGFKITPEVEASIRRNVRKLKNMPWNAIGSLLVYDILDQPTYQKALQEMDRLGLLEVVKEIIQDTPPFQAWLAKEMRSRKVQFLLDMMDMSIPVKMPFDFLSPAQQVQFRENLPNLGRMTPEEYLAVLTKPPVDNMRFIEKYNLQGRDRGKLIPLARELLLAEPVIALNKDRLNARMDGALLRGR